jgi:plastocyanin
VTPSPRRATTAVLASAVLTVGAVACGSSATKTSAGGSAAMTAKVKIVKFTFSPMTVTVKVGGTVTWLQVDSVGHSVQSDDGAWATSAVLMPGQTFSHTFTRAGTYNYICGVHPYMKGTVSVTR